MACDRREFVGLAVGALAGAVLPGCASVAALPMRAEGGVLRVPLRDHPRLTQPGGWLKVRPEGVSTAVYILNLGEEYAALSPVCQHLGCTVNLEGPQLVCPCHGSTYARDGSVLRGPTQKPLIRYPASVTPEGELVIRVLPS
jgi:Rieske Fe-S protein